MEVTLDLKLGQKVARKEHEEEQEMASSVISKMLAVVPVRVSMWIWCNY